jgi:broad specificity phosphatase PhoE
MTKLILVRHGETETNIQGKIHKFSDPEQLNLNGELQIKKTSGALKKYEPVAVYTSRETRALQSAEIISATLNVPMFTVDGLEERNWGNYAGLSFQEIKLRAGMDKMSFEDRYTFHPPNGESWKEVEARLLKALDHILAANKDKTVILVTHGGSIRTLMPTLMNIDRIESYKYDPENASISIFDYENKKFEKVVYNDTSHLSS